MVSLHDAFILSVLITVSLAYEECYMRQKRSGASPGGRPDNGPEKKLTCADRCCGNIDSRYCCSTSATTSGLSTPAVAGIAVGVVALIGIIVGITLYCVCCRKSSRREQGRAVKTNKRAVKPSGTPKPAFNPGYGYPAQPHPGGAPPAGLSYPPPPYSPPTQIVSIKPTAPAYVPNSRKASPPQVDPPTMKKTPSPTSEYPASVSDSHVYETIP
ncbi:cysteine and tyrosine-rich protein 1-like [Haliotis rubra]|uniref:cysteine and tyrosine-rich protein 1-like n=1 Tax=Haliotis rubra TaxID=36100 RepID=UPI001EE6185C|nr:cysteine and tyrosine-rich protein 1-like [Haliotis rubra]